MGDVPLQEIHKDQNAQTAHDDRDVKLTELFTAIKQQTDLLSQMQSSLKAIEQAAGDLNTSSSEHILNSITLIAGLLVVAAFPVMTQDLSTISLHTLSPHRVRTYAAASIGLFLLVIIFSQAIKLTIRLARSAKSESRANEVPTKSYWSSLRALALPVLLLEYLALAIFCLFLIVNEFVANIGFTLVLLDGFFALVALVSWIIWPYFASRRNGRGARSRMSQAVPSGTI